MAVTSALLGGLVTAAPVRADSACPTGGPDVVLHLPQGSTQTVTANQICMQSDLPAVTYQVRAVPDGAVQDAPVTDALSINSLLDGASGVGFVEIPRQDGSWSVLSAPDLTRTGDFGGLVPSVHVDGAVVEYDRPLRSDPSDTNAADIIRASSLDVYLHTGPLLHPTVTVAPSTTAPGQAVTATVTVSDAPAGAQPLTVSWDFGDGGTGTGTSASHTYAAAGGTAPKASPRSSRPPGATATRKPVPSKPVTSHAAASAVPSRALASPVVSTPSRPAPATATASSVPSLPSLPSSASASPSVPVVSGLLIGAQQPVASAAPSKPFPSSPPASSGDSSPAGVALGGLIGVGLLGLGAAWELRRGKRR